MGSGERHLPKGQIAGEGHRIFPFFLLLVMLLPLCVNPCRAQTQELRRFVITPVDPPERNIPVFRDYPDKAALIIHSSLPNLTFESNMGGIVDYLGDPTQGIYRIVVEPYTQIFHVSAPNFMRGSFRVAGLSPRDVRYYEIEPERELSNLISVIFNVSPPDAKLYIDDQITETNRTVQLTPGSKFVRLEREGYRVIERSVAVSPQNISFTFEMEEIDVVLLRIRSNLQGARVKVDGTERGITDRSGGLDLFLYPGTYALSISRSGYIAQNMNLEVSEEGENRVDVELESNIGTLSLQVDPSDAVVRLNRRDYSGESRIELAPGRYRLEVEKQGYEPHSETIDIALNEQKRRTVSLEAHTGSLQFTVSPTNAEARLVDGSERTVERWEGSRLLRGLRVGSYKLLIEASGYERGEQTIVIRKDETLPVSVVLKRVVVEERPTPSTRPAPVTRARDNTTTVVEIKNPATGRVWMDRNLGASRAATSSTDSQAYGDLYQWGRAADGHQKRSSSTTTTLSNSDQPGHSNFILAPNRPYDWRSPKSDNLWQGVNGTNNPCPPGYRLPTDAEWDAERSSWSSNNASGAFGSPLKLPVAGLRSYSSGSLFAVGSRGYYWSKAVSGRSARYLFFNSSLAGMYSDIRANGNSVRCLEDY